MITEEQKQEADRILKLYTPKDSAGFDTLPRRVSIRFAIQDRQSVLEAFNKIPYRSKCEDYKIQSLNAQIEYLKSKLE